MTHRTSHARHAGRHPRYDLQPGVGRFVSDKELPPCALAAYGHTVTSGSVAVALLGLAAVILFAYLDANNLQHVRRLEDVRCLTGSRRGSGASRRH